MSCYGHAQSCVQHLSQGVLGCGGCVNELSMPLLQLNTGTLCAWFRLHWVAGTLVAVWNISLGVQCARLGPCCPQWLGPLLCLQLAW